ncbi:hypothetical protein Cgig2_028656 [Carnegiea gigantea]|uniref:Uncharacterized protein n=1 Tax=Carnegiea gigantea TaxID=171969 RepID=A0A9Q1JLB6_9CARY|nr:hypothetical protein Cgig2_028656 [Carnegiea gigantea]
MDIFDAEPNPTECMGQSDDVDFKEKLKHIPLPSRSQCFPSIEQIALFGKDLFDSGLRLDGSQVVSVLTHKAHAPSLVLHPLRVPKKRFVSIFNAKCCYKEVDNNAAWVFGQAILDKVSRTPFNELPSLKGVDATPVQNRIVGLIKQTFHFKDLLESYYSQMTAKEQDSYRIKVQGKLVDASQQLNAEDICYKAPMAELKQVESRREELLKELQLLEDQKIDRMIDLQGQIDIIIAIKVMNAATKTSLEKNEAYIKESFGDVKNLQWNLWPAHPPFCFFRWICHVLPTFVMQACYVLNKV